jgi:hypothetical protein
VRCHGLEHRTDIIVRVIGLSSVPFPVGNRTTRIYPVAQAPAERRDPQI